MEADAGITGVLFGKKRCHQLVHLYLDGVGQNGNVLGRDIRRVKQHLGLHGRLKMLEQLGDACRLEAELLQASGIRLQITQSLHLAIDQMLVQVLGNIDKAHGLMEDDQRKLVMIRHFQHVSRNRRDVFAKLDAQPGCFAPNQFSQIGKPLLFCPAKTKPCREDEFAAIEKLSRICGFQDMHPANRTSQSAVARDHFCVLEQRAFDCFCDRQAPVIAHVLLLFLPAYVKRAFFQTDN